MACLLAALPLQALTSSRLKSPSYDETLYPVLGYAYWRTGDHTLGREHLPLGKLLTSALWLLRDDVAFDEERYRAHHELEVTPPGFQFAQDVLFRSGNDHEALIESARFPGILLATLTGLMLFLWARTTLGTFGALAAWTLFVTSPDLIAHARTATLDIYVTCFSLLALLAFHRTIATARTSWAIVAGVLTGLAIASKLTGVLLLPTFLLITLLVAWPLRMGAFPRRGAVRCNLALLASTAVALVLCYLPFRNWPTCALEHLVTSIRGARQFQREFPFYLNGEHSTAGFPSYYVQALGMKLTLGSLALIALGIVVSLRRSRWSLGLAYAIAAAVPIAALSYVGHNIGVRYVLPAVPVLFVLGGLAACDAGRARTATVSLLVLISALECAVIWPHHLSSFNLLAGGPSNAPQHLDDSNVDWGQDLKGLATYLGENDIDRVRLQYLGTALPEAYGIQAEAIPFAEYFLPREDVLYAVSVTSLVREMSGEPWGFRHGWRRRFHPVGRIGFSIYLYRFHVLDPGEAPRAGTCAIPRRTFLEQALEDVTFHRETFPDYEPTREIEAAIRAALART
ncbi:MAG: glycosyltransferase family 39 protein [Planctomycetes bacterium]|nr:glycosyltransferase family 39 protein [Planctomycetota bacterium]